MKYLLVFALIALYGVTGNTMEVTTWATAVSKQPSTGRAIIFRYAKSFRKGFQRADFPDRIILVWKYKSENGMPITSEHEAMDRMEDLIEPLIEKSGQCILALVSTGENLREWIFYARSEQEFLTALNKSLDGKPRFPIEVHASTDPQWSTYDRFINGVRE